MYTDPNHLTIEQPGQVEGNVVFTYLDAFHSDSVYIDQLKLRYREGGLSNGTTKKILEDCLQDLLQPIRKRRELLISDKSQLIDILKLGSEKSQEQSNQVLNNVKNAFGLKLF
jgi:tryptophanyl-tRNA synthetase